MKRGLHSITKKWPTVNSILGLIDGFIASFAITISWKVFLIQLVLSDGGWCSLVCWLRSQPNVISLECAWAWSDFSVLKSDSNTREEKTSNQPLPLPDKTLIHRKSLLTIVEMESSKHTKSDTLIFSFWGILWGFLHFRDLTKCILLTWFLPMCIFPFLYVQLCVPHFSQQIRERREEPPESTYREPKVTSTLESSIKADHYIGTNRKGLKNEPSWQLPICVMSRKNVVCKSSPKRGRIHAPTTIGR